VGLLSGSTGGTSPDARRIIHNINVPKVDEVPM
jgi:hypothetical protein